MTVSSSIFSKKEKLICRKRSLSKVEDGFCSSSDEERKGRLAKKASNSKKSAPIFSGETVPQTLEIEYWERTDECLHKKWDHMDYIDERFPSREDFILQTVLHQSKVMLEPNMFPYDCGPNILHWTLWSTYELTDAEAIAYVNKWLLKYMPEAVEWNFDSNDGLRSIWLYHVHIYIRIENDMSRSRMQEIIEQGGDDEMLESVMAQTSRKCCPVSTNENCTVTYVNA